ncbi:MAG: trehalose-6-phosphate synthase, partial [Candidatus Omnitrophota bacterium]|nr:trehalose-6-phosphate synthase [Candidatus Omnitrophota bacterium]
GDEAELQRLDALVSSNPDRGPPEEAATLAQDLTIALQEALRLLSVTDRPALDVPAHSAQRSERAPNPLKALSDPTIRQFIRDLLIRQYSRYALLFEGEEVESVVDGILQVAQQSQEDPVATGRRLNAQAFDFANPEGAFRQAEQTYLERYFGDTRREAAAYEDEWYVGGKILDVGAGYNRFLKNFADRHPDRDAQLIGTDVIDYQEEDPRVQFIHQTTHRLPVDAIGRGTVTAARVSRVIHHIHPEAQDPHSPGAREKVLAFLHDLYDALAPGGQVVIYEDSYPELDELISDAPFEAMDQEMTARFLSLSDAQKYQWMVWNDWYWNIYASGLYDMPMAYRYYTMGEWQQLFREAGFDMAEAQYWGFQPSFLHGGSQAFFVIRKPGEESAESGSGEAVPNPINEPSDDHAPGREEQEDLGRSAAPESEEADKTPGPQSRRETTRGSGFSFGLGEQALPPVQGGADAEPEITSEEHRARLAAGLAIFEAQRTTIENGYDVRGVTDGPGATMTPEFAYTAAVGLATMLRRGVQDDRRPRVLVLGDQRASTVRLRQAWSEGLKYQGVDVDASDERVSTPAANRVPRAGNRDTDSVFYDAVVQITASHNPWTWRVGTKRTTPENGFKISVLSSYVKDFLGEEEEDGYLRGIYGEMMAHIISQAGSAEGFGIYEEARWGQVWKVDDVLRRYIAHFTSHLNQLINALGLTKGEVAEQLVLVVDAGNGVMEHVAKEVLKAVGIEAVFVHRQATQGPEGHPAHPADPNQQGYYRTHLTKRVQAVAKGHPGKTVLGIALDGDGDRMGLTDEGGTQYLTPDQQASLFYTIALATDPQAPVVLDIRSGQEVVELVHGDISAEELAEKPWHAPGWPIVRRAMRKHGAFIGVEASQHTFMRPFDDPNEDPIDDGLWAGVYAALTSMAWQRKGTSIHDLVADRRWYPTLTAEEFRPNLVKPRDRIDLLHEINEGVTAGIEAALPNVKIVRIPSPSETESRAARLQLSDKTGRFIGWILIRASNTSAKLSITGQGVDEATRGILVGVLRDVLRGIDAIDQSDVSKALGSESSVSEPPAVSGGSTKELSDEELLARIQEQLEVADLASVKARLGEDPLVFVINRSIITLDVTPAGVDLKRPPGGAAASVYDALRRSGGGLVIATALTPAERLLAQRSLFISPATAAQPEQNIWVKYVAIDDDVYHKFYNQFANPALWLIQHQMAERLVRRPGWRDVLRRPLSWLAYYFPWAPTRYLGDVIFTQATLQAYKDGYQHVNRQYAEAVMAAVGELPGAKIMIQDYHFYFLPHYLREAGSEALLDHFIHIPWPSPRYLQLMMPEPILRELLEALLANDVLGFQIPSYAYAFMGAAKQILGADVDYRNGLVTYRRHTTLVRDYPISVDVGNLRVIAIQEGTMDYVQRLRRKLGDHVLIYRADRVDLSKGIPEGIDALDRLLTEHPNVRGRVTMLAHLQPSRTDVPQYEELMDEVQEKVIALNAQWTPEADWNGLIQTAEDHADYLKDLEQPQQSRRWPLMVVDLSDTPYAEVVGAQVAAEIGLVNALADGMNLVAKEFAANNKPDFLDDYNRRLKRRFDSEAVTVDPGVLVGSTRMGAYPELKEGLIPVNPASVESTADGLYRAYQLHQRERVLLPLQGLTRLRAALTQGGLRSRAATARMLAERAGGQVAEHTLVSWMNSILRDVELVRDPLWVVAVRRFGLLRARGYAEHGRPLSEVLPDQRAPPRPGEQGGGDPLQLFTPIRRLIERLKLLSQAGFDAARRGRGLPWSRFTPVIIAAITTAGLLAAALTGLLSVNPIGALGAMVVIGVCYDRYVESRLERQRAMEDAERQRRRKEKQEEERKRKEEEEQRRKEEEQRREEFEEALNEFADQLDQVMDDEGKIDQLLDDATKHDIIGSLVRTVGNLTDRRLLSAETLATQGAADLVQRGVFTQADQQTLAETLSGEAMRGAVDRLADTAGQLFKPLGEADQEQLEEPEPDDAARRQALRRAQQQTRQQPPRHLGGHNHLLFLALPFVAAAAYLMLVAADWADPISASATFAPLLFGQVEPTPPESQDGEGLLEETEEDPIKRFTVNLSQLARDNQLDEQEISAYGDYIQRLDGLLAAGSKKNVVLVGDPDVTHSFVETVVREIADPARDPASIPENLRNREFLYLNVASLLYLLAEIGRFEETIQDLTEALDRAVREEGKQYVFVFDFQQIHWIRVERSKLISSVSFLFKRVLQNTQIPVIGLANPQHYNEFFQSDRETLKNSFETLEFGDLPQFKILDNVRAFLRRVKDIYADLPAHVQRVTVKRETLEQTVDYVRRFMPYGQLPGKIHEMIDRLITRRIHQAEADQVNQRSLGQKIMRTLAKYREALPRHDDRELQYLNELLQRDVEQLNTLQAQLQQEKAETAWELPLEEFV